MFESSKIKELLNGIKEKRPDFNDKSIEASYSFLKKQLKELPVRDRKRILSETLNIASALIEIDPRPEIIAAGLLFNFAETAPDALNKIKHACAADIYLLTKAHCFAKKMAADHNLDFRHFSATAYYLAEMKLTVQVVAAGFLHNLLSPIYNVANVVTIKQEFGQEIAEMLENYQKISNLKPLKTARHVEDLRQMLIAFAKDPRVILIKLCSLLDIVKNIDAIPQHKREEAAKEALDVFAHIADLLGIWRLRWQLEDYAFKYLMPQEYAKIEKHFNVDERKNREKYIYKTAQIVQKACRALGITAEINGRFKHFYSIHLKMKNKNKPFDEICDVFALRIIVNNVDECYRVLGIIHGIWKPKNRRFKDYISTPKENGYRALHTVVFGLNSRMTEFQIRTREMDEEAKYGIASHWYYKNQPEKTPLWIRELIDQQQYYATPEEFLENVSTKLLIKKIYTYTPKGDIIDLPEGATPVDFAYAVHTELGNKMSSAKLNGVPVPLNMKINTGDVIEIVIDEKQIGPKPEWLNFAKTPFARKQIEKFIENQST
ncbi:bifunctional (p)ppGpp synthetase/guanosine-3',5'-bis(diphosphate) 3'-pyrophosphohydrolase [Candidatus Falkowbacteria bacterium]|nr:bifunctional (p)ppGpp synthetase/guanosine-3',5'-bis(diphosphate) 3'-pyrophosphohydrolase [Candidatus Falkowbacteria bacterium]